VITREDIANKLKELIKITKTDKTKYTKDEIKVLMKNHLQELKEKGEIFGIVKEYKYITKDTEGKNIVNIINIEEDAIHRIISDLNSYEEFRNITDIIKK